jgi:hypothetical protein
VIMRRLTDDEIVTFATVGRHNREFAELLDTLRTEELELMVKCGSLENFCTSKGRVQMLTEILQQLRSL